MKIEGYTKINIPGYLKLRNWGECHKKSLSNAKTIASKIPIFITKLPVCIDNASKDQLTNTDTQEGVRS